MTDINKVVQVTISSSPTFPAQEGFGLMNIVGSSATLPIGDRFRFYGDLAAVGVDYSANSEEYKAATSWFSQNPKPIKLAISRRFATAVAGELIGSSGITTVLATYQAITTGSFGVSVNGVLKQVTGLDFSAAASLNAIAAIIQTRLIAATAAGATCVFQNGRFILTSNTTGPASTMGFAVAPLAGVDVSALLGLAAANGGKVTAGSAIESITTALNNLQIINGSWYGVALTNEATETEILEAAAWVEALVKVHAANSTNANNKDASSVLSLSYKSKAAGYRRTLVEYDDNDPYAAVSAFARAFTVNFSQPNSTITLMFKQQPGVSVTALTETERHALEGNNCNYYTLWGDVAMLAKGVMSDGTFFDEVQGLDALQLEIENSVFSYLYSRPTKVPQTDKGVATLVQRVEKAFDVFVSNGMLAPGQWDGDDLGTVKSGDFLPKGYYAVAGRVADQPQVDRDARQAPPISAIALGAGAIHGVAIGVTFQR